MNKKGIVTQLDKLLLPLGFKRRKYTWNRTSDSCVDVIDIQSSKSNDALTVNVGVLSPAIYEECWGTEISGFVEEPFCTVRSRIGPLMSDRDVWWLLSDHNAAFEISEAVSTHALPFATSLHGEVEMEKWLVRSRTARRYPPEAIYLALLKNRRGDHVGACAILEELQRNTTDGVGGWGERVRVIGDRLGCRRPKEMKR